MDEECEKANANFFKLVATTGGDKARAFLKELPSDELDALHQILHMHMIDVTSGKYMFEGRRGVYRRAATLATMHTFVKREEKLREQGYALSEEQDQELLAEGVQILSLMTGIPVDNIVVAHEGSKFDAQLDAEGNQDALIPITKEQVDKLKAEGALEAPKEKEQVVTPEAIARAIDDLLAGIPQPGVNPLGGQQKRLPPA